MYKPWDANSTALKSIFLDYWWNYYMLTPWAKNDNSIIDILLKQQINIYDDANNFEKKILSIHQLINKVAWYIPIKKLRDKFRSKFFL